jgi:hypothetical protein
LEIQTNSDIKDIEKYFKSPLLPSKKKEGSERQLQNQMQKLVNLLLKPKVIKKEKKEVTLADKLNMLDNFEKEANHIKHTNFSDDEGRKIFDKTKRKLLQTITNRKLGLSLCNKSYFFF